SGGSAGVSGGATGGTASDDTTGGSASDDTTGTGGTFAGRDEPSGSAPQGGQPRGVPIATASLQGNLTGTIQFLSGDDGDDVKNALVNVKGSQPGSYGVYLFKGSDCAQIRQMKSPFGQGEQGSGEPQGWKTVGSISLGAGQQQMSQLPLNDLSRDDLQDQSIVLFPIGSAGATPTSNATPAGCGQVQVTASPADQPSG
ncbi:hypothetical protein L6R52_34195, partial [Myxococcota bacterium]|nr:hypothetical protein [Myxococcota bacterium]